MDIMSIAMAKAMMGGGGGGTGGGLFVATYTLNGDTWECDKTLAEILAAIEAGKSVWAYDGEEDFYCALNTFYPGEDGNVEFGYIHFALHQGNVTLMYSKLMHTSDHISVTYGSGSFPSE